MSDWLKLALGVLLLGLAYFNCCTGAARTTRLGVAAPSGPPQFGARWQGNEGMQRNRRIELDIITGTANVQAK